MNLHCKRERTRVYTRYTPGNRFKYSTHLMSYLNGYIYTAEFETSVIYSYMLFFFFSKQKRFFVRTRNTHTAIHRLKKHIYSYTMAHRRKRRIFATIHLNNQLQPERNYDFFHKDDRRQTCSLFLEYDRSSRLNFVLFKTLSPSDEEKPVYYRLNVFLRHNDFRTLFV